MSVCFLCQGYDEHDDDEYVNYQISFQHSTYKKQFVQFICTVLHPFFTAPSF